MRSPPTKVPLIEFSSTSKNESSSRKNIVFKHESPLSSITIRAAFVRLTQISSSSLTVSAPPTVSM
ncbi:MAG: hypothetical protein M3R11_10385 [Acidobacteriota bacterium]|jgi:hypothetical protein|nr:hypothetical protein [Acidobacteriota bacterium]